MFLKDAKSVGLKVNVGLGNPNTVPKEVVNAADQSKHMACSKKGDTVNGQYLYWDIPCVSKETYISDAKKFYHAFYTMIASDSELASAVSAITIGGTWGLPFFTEFRFLER